MLPLRDDIRSYSRPFVTYGLIGLNIVVFLYEISLGDTLNGFIQQFGAVPYTIFHPSGPGSYCTLISSMFIHASLMHIAGNMLFLWIFGDNIEDRMGHVFFFIFYVISGLAGALLHSITAPGSLVPMVGASGAISGIMGAYILLYPKARILALVPLGFFLRIMKLPALLFLGVWFLYQFLLGILSIGVKGGGVAYFAHIGGFAVGLVIALPFKFTRNKGDIDYSVQ
ncbi:rhomboid family intramembrane serine protease [candidate division WOR-3 bacterium]|nr:rhomboid family intramembrane serine protease [candidate division WOR-3 bacterium]